MTEENKKKAFLVEILEKFEYPSARPCNKEKKTAYLIISCYFMFDENRDNVRKRVREELSLLTDSPGKYKLNIKEVQKLRGIYKLGLGKLG